MLVDSHCHLHCIDLTEHFDSMNNLINNAFNHDVGHMLCVSLELERFSEICEIANKFDNISVSVGVHPNNTDCIEPSVDLLIEYATHNKCVAIGETGLDYFRSEKNSPWQLDRFRTHIQAAIIANKPLIIHTRSAVEDTIKIMREEQAQKIGGVMHCFSENWEMAQQALDLGFYISFSGIVTFKNARDLQEVARKVPLDKMLIETDSPYLAPTPFRGKQNQPAYVEEVAKFIAEMRGLEYDEFSEITTNNFFNLFKHAVNITPR